MKKKKKSGLNGYVVFLLVYVFLALLAGFFGLRYLWLYAEEYEASFPEKALDAYLSELRQEQWSEGVERAVAAMPHEVQSEEELEQAVRTLLQGELRLRRESSSETELRYTLLSAGRPIGKLTLVPDSEKESSLRFGRCPWRIGEESYDFSSLYSTISIKVPSSYSVTVNGFALGEQFIVERELPIPALADYYEAFPGLMTEQVYRYDHAIGDMSFTVYDQNGLEVPPEELEDEARLLNNCTLDQRQRLESFIAVFADRYASYMGGMGGHDAYRYYQGNLAGYIEPGSELERRLVDAADGLYWTSTQAVTVSGLTIRSVTYLSDGCYLCDYSVHIDVRKAIPTSSDVNVRLLVRDHDGDLRVTEYEQY